MVTNQITKLNLEPRIRDLKTEGKTERQIAAILSQEMNQKITKSAVHRYLAGNVKLAQQAVESSNKLRVKVAELELDTVQARHELIKEIRELAQQAKESGDLKTALIGLDKAVTAIDSLDKRLGKFSGQPETQVNVMVQQNQQFNEFMKVILSEVNEIDRVRIISKLKQNALY